MNWKFNPFTRRLDYVGSGGGGGGEANTASNLGAGEGLFATKVGVDLRFKSLTGASGRVLLSSSPTEVDLDVDESAIDIAALGGTLDHGSLGGVTANQHHNQVHTLADTTGLGADHTTSGLTAGQVLRATGAAAARFMVLDYADLSGTPSSLPPSGAAGGDLTGTYPNPTIADADLIAIRDLAATAGMLSRTGAGAFAARTLAVTDSASIDFTITDPTGAAGNPTITGVVLPAGVDHNSLANLTTGDVHTHYLLLAGRSGGQTAKGGTGDGDDLSLISTNHPTKGSIFLDTNMEIQADFAATAGSDTRTLLNWAKTLNIFGTSNVVNLVRLAPDFTINSTVPGDIIWFNADGTITASTANTLASLAAPFKITTQSISASSGIVPHALHNFWCTPTFDLQGVTAADSVAGTTIPGFWENIVIKGTAGGKLTYSVGALEGFRSTPGMHAKGSGATLAYQRNGVHIADIAYTTDGTPTRGTITLAYNRGVMVDNFATGGQGGTVTVNEMTAFWTAMTSGTGKWAILGTGSADSSLGGRLFVGNTGSVVPNTDLDVDGDFATRAANLALSNGNNDNIAIGARSFIRITGPTGAFVIRGIASGFDGKRLVIFNTTTQNMTFNHNDGGSTAANQITTMTGAAVATTAAGCAELIYDATLSKWLLLYVTA